MRLDGREDERGLKLPTDQRRAQHRLTEFCRRTFEVELERRAGSGSLFLSFLQVGNSTDKLGDLTRVTQQVAAELRLLTPGPSKSMCRNRGDTLFSRKSCQEPLCSPPWSLHLISSTRIYNCWTNLLQGKKKKALPSVGQKTPKLLASIKPPSSPHTDYIPACKVTGALVAY